jgi:hypothetical protein
MIKTLLNQLKKLIKKLSFTALLKRKKTKTKMTESQTQSNLKIVKWKKANDLKVGDMVRTQNNGDGYIVLIFHHSKKATVRFDHLNGIRKTFAISKLKKKY